MKKCNFKSIFLVFLFCSFILNLQSQTKTVEQRIDSVLNLMTLDEKVGQLNQYSSSWATGPVTIDEDKSEAIKSGRVGALLNTKGVENTRKMQSLAMQSRLKIPLLFGYDVIHGYKTTFPIPLAEAASWDLQFIELSARMAAVEAAAAGIHWTFAPMVDISHDPRWGRVLEGAGEDPYLGSLIAKARVKGFQGKGFGNTDAVMACVKHFAAYGAIIGGREYNSVDMSERTLWEVYMPPYKAACEAGAATFMNSFNDLNGIPATGNAYLQREILKGKWGFTGFVVSDWGSIGEMIEHGFAKNQQEAAFKAITAGNDMDMESRSYIKNLTNLVTIGKVDVALLNDAVRRILRKKFEMGLFDNPFKYCDLEREKQAINNPKHRKHALEMAKRSIVLLKNEQNLLPLSKTKKIAIIGPLAKSNGDMKGGWSIEWENDTEFVSPFEGLENRIGKTNILYAKGCEINDSSKTGFSEALKIANQADIVILSIGEDKNMSAEARSRSNISLPGVQEDLVKAIYETGKPIIALISAGRPLVFNWTADHAHAILYTWWLGSEAGNAIADVIFGTYNPSAKLPMTFPRSVGQIPIYYNYMNTGRPRNDDEFVPKYLSGYIDLAKSPKYPFGFGLSYTTFAYSDLTLSSNKMKCDETIDVSFKITNTGKVTGEEIVQLYLQDEVASLIRPVKELKDFTKVMLKASESKIIHFTIDKQKLSFYNNKLEWITEAGTFKLMIGASSADIRLTKEFELE